MNEKIIARKNEPITAANHGHSRFTISGLWPRSRAQRAITSIVGALLLYPAMGIPGLALAFSLAYTITALVTLATMSHRLGGLRGRQIGSTFARVLVVGVVMGAVAWYVSDALGYASPSAAILAVIVGATASVAIGIAGLRLLRVRELTELRDAFRPATREVAVSE